MFDNVKYVKIEEGTMTFYIQHYLLEHVEESRLDLSSALMQYSDLAVDRSRNVFVKFRFDAVQMLDALLPFESDDATLKVGDKVRVRKTIKENDTYYWVDAMDALIGMEFVVSGAHLNELNPTEDSYDLEGLEYGFIRDWLVKVR